MILCHHFPIFLLFSVRDKRTGPNTGYNTWKTQAQVTAVRKHHYLPALYNICAMEASTVFTLFEATVGLLNTREAVFEVVLQPIPYWACTLISHKTWVESEVPEKM